MENIIDNVEKELLNFADEKYKNFSLKFINTNHNLIGVKIPILKKISKEICKGNYLIFLNENPFNFYEEYLLQGFVLATCNLEISKKYLYLKSLISKIDNWAECDYVCASLKFFNFNLNETLNFIMPFYNSENEFEQRFAIVTLLTYFVNDAYILKVLNLLEQKHSEKYYVQMAVAWAFQVCFVNYYDETFKFFKSAKLSKFVFNKTISKCMDSFKLNVQQKNEIKNLKEKKK